MAIRGTRVAVNRYPGRRDFDKLRGRDSGVYPPHPNRTPEWGYARAETGQAPTPSASCHLARISGLKKLVSSPISDS